MRRLAALLVAALPLAGCAALPPPSASFADAPLRARIVSDPTGLAVTVSGDAHVALFEVVPGIGAGLVYPAAYAEGRRLHAGFNRLVLPPLDSHRWSYLPHSTGYGPRFYLLLASREPLRVGPYVDSPFALRREMGRAHFAALNAYGTMDRLAERVIPPQPEGDWDTDVLVVWPEHPVTERNPLVRVQCPNGRVLVVPWSLSVAACELSERRVTPPPARDTTSSGEDGGEGEDGVRAPEPRRPEPAGEEGEGERRVRPGTGERTRPGVPVRADPAPLAPAPPTLEPVVRHPEGEPLIREPAVREPEERPRVEPTPRVEPVPQAEEPRVDPAPRVEEPRVEPTPRAEPREEPRVEPRRADPPRSRPAPARANPAPRRAPPPSAREPAPSASRRPAPAPAPRPQPSPQRAERARPD